MTTAWDVIRDTIAATLKLDEQNLADEILSALLSAPEPVRLELAAELNPMDIRRCPRCGWRAANYETLPEGEGK
jgi:hypothetical protein